MAAPVKTLLIAAGPTREMLDPVRFLSNLSTGEMGYMIAAVARDKKYKVTLVSGPTSLKPPEGVRFVPVVSARDMQRACQKFFPRHDALIMPAAVCDFTAGKRHRQKIHRTKTTRFLLKQTPDIIAGLAKRKRGRIVIGFCLETEDWLANAKAKLRRKHLDGIVANYYGRQHVPFGDRKITAAFLDENEVIFLRSKTKRQIARKLLSWMESLRKRIEEENER